MVITAIKNGADTRKAIIKATGLSYGWIGNCLRLLLAQYDCKNLYELGCVLVPPVIPKPKPKYTSYDSVILDPALDGNILNLNKQRVLYQRMLATHHPLAEALTTIDGAIGLHGDLSPAEVDRLAQGWRLALLAAIGAAHEALKVFE